MSETQEYQVRGPVFKPCDELLFVGIKRRVTPQTPSAVRGMWDDFLQRIGEIENVAVTHPFGVCISVEDGPGMDYMVGLSVNNFSFIPRDMNTCVVPEGEYAVFTHVGSLDFFPKTMQHIFGEWMPNADVQHSGGPELEVYDQRFDPDTQSGEVDYRVPVNRN